MGEEGLAAAPATTNIEANNDDKENNYNSEH